MTPAPIALFVYKRLRHARMTVDALLRNAEASVSDLFIYSDGPRSDADREAVAEVRSYLRTVAGFRSVTVVEREVNYGLARSIIDGVTTLTGRYGQVIVVEDDLVTSPYFLRYMNDALELYRDVPEVISVHGYVYPVARPLPESFFLIGADCWGWATWKRGWELFEPDGAALLRALTEKGLLRRFDLDGAYPYSRMLKDQIAGKVDSWAIRWNASAFLHGRLTLYPGRSLVNNIGGDELGTHTKTLEGFTTTVSPRPVLLTPLPPAENADAREAVKEFFRSVRPTFVRRAAGWLKRLTS
ncbi:MAG: glycosyltransferase [Bacteroidetes bacterium]|nr:MAG: glycosyltransferase [Bacteroidota bacterium]